ncbi:hypothetical protein B0H66DRAFT_567403 [Apodospora peruviana]|uniref:rhomboid protease n=1 Tax=Apodospora peruviana TaxID=516989 RepID=A0AAE0HVZ4_9PEZI|nr:hypothetical protein B0H66DRAFT_567403 [Apodospora peruviana]
MPTPSIPSFNTSRARAYVFRLPLFTRAVVAIIVATWLLSLQQLWDVRAWGALVPDKTGMATLYRTNTFPFIHLNIFHAILNILALTPLLERFESEHGTLTSLALFFGPFATVPALLYVGLERFVYGGNTVVMGASVWVFLLLGVEAIHTYRTNPHFRISSYDIPTWTTPMIVMLCVAALVPGSSFLGHLCGLVVGYAFGLGYIKFLAPPEKILRYIEGKLNLLGRLPHYVSVDQKTYGRFGILPSSGNSGSSSAGPAVAMGMVGSGQRLGP